MRDLSSFFHFLTIEGLLVLLHSRRRMIPDSCGLLFFPNCARRLLLTVVKQLQTHRHVVHFLCPALRTTLLPTSLHRVVLTPVPMGNHIWLQHSARCGTRTGSYTSAVRELRQRERLSSHRDMTCRVACHHTLGITHHTPFGRPSNTCVLLRNPGDWQGADTNVPTCTPHRRNQKCCSVIWNLHVLLIWRHPC